MRFSLVLPDADRLSSRNEYAQVLSKRVHEEREKRADARKRRASSMKK